MNPAKPPTVRYTDDDGSPRASCAIAIERGEIHPDAWFPPEGEEPEDRPRTGRPPANTEPTSIYDAPAAARALAICGGCPIREACLATAMGSHHTIRYGIWGGTTPEQRLRYRRRYREALRKAAA